MRALWLPANKIRYAPLVILEKKPQSISSVRFPKYYSRVSSRARNSEKQPAGKKAEKILHFLSFSLKNILIDQLSAYFNWQYKFLTKKELYY